MLLKGAPSIAGTDGLLEQGKSFFVLVYVKERPPKELASKWYNVLLADIR